MQLTKQKADYLMLAIDTLIRQTGLQNAAMGLALVADIQADLNLINNPPKVEPEKEPEAKEEPTDAGA